MYYLKKNVKKKDSGITLMELIIALAIIAVITAIIAVNLFGTTDRARLRSDVQSTIVLRSATEIFRIGGREVPGSFDELITLLYSGGYINSDNYSPQTGGNWIVGSTDRVYLVLPTDFSLDLGFLNDNEIELIARD